MRLYMNIPLITTISSMPSNWVGFKLRIHTIFVPFFFHIFIMHSSLSSLPTTHTPTSLCETVSPMSTLSNRSGSTATATSGRFVPGTPRLWPVFSQGALRRRITHALMCGLSNQKSAPTPPSTPPEESPTMPDPKRTLLLHLHHHGDRLEDLFNKAENSEVKMNNEAFDDFKDVVRRLQSGDGDGGMIGSRRKAAMDVRKLTKDDANARKTLALLGAIPPLLAMLDVYSDLETQISVLYALLNLSIANDLNKAAIVEAGMLKKIQILITGGAQPPPALSEAIAANLLGLSALDSNKSLIGAIPNSIPFLLSTFHCPHSSSQSKNDSLRALFNLTLSPSNTPYFLSASLIPSLISSIADTDALADRVLSILSNLASSSEGRGAIARAPDSFLVLIDVLRWNDEPCCQENAIYLLMVLAHKSCRNRAVMVEKGIVSCLLELSLFGTAIAQKRAARVLELLRVDQGKQMSEGFGVVDGAGTAATEEMGMSEERIAVRELVQMSLQNNLRRIVRRANLPDDLNFPPSEHFKTVVTTSTCSKSLPL